MHQARSSVYQSAFLILLAILVGMIFLPSPGTADVDFWRFWINNAWTQGVVEGYSANADFYPPLASLFLFCASQIFGKAGLLGSIKLAIFFFLLLAALVSWLWTRSLTATLVIYFALFLNSVALGYIDIFFAPTLILAFWMLQERRLLWFSVFFTISLLTKWQPIIIAPFIGLYILDIGPGFRWRQVDWRRLVLQLLLPALSLIASVVLIFGAKPILNALNLSVRNNFLSGNALNLSWIITHFLHVVQPGRYGGLENGMANFIEVTPPEVARIPNLLFYGIFIVSLVFCFLREKTFKNLTLFSILGFLAYCVFKIGVHENHFFTVAVLAGVLFWLDERFRIVAVILMLISNINLFVFYGVDGTLHFPRTVGALDIALPLAVFNVVFFFYFFWFVLINSRSGERPPVANSRSEEQLENAG